MMTEKGKEEKIEKLEVPKSTDLPQSPYLW